MSRQKCTIFREYTVQLKSLNSVYNKKGSTNSARLRPHCRQEPK